MIGADLTGQVELALVVQWIEHQIADLAVSRSSRLEGAKICL